MPAVGAPLQEGSTWTWTWAVLSDSECLHLVSVQEGQTDFHWGNFVHEKFFIMERGFRKFDFETPFPSDVQGAVNVPNREQWVESVNHTVAYDGTLWRLARLDFDLRCGDTRAWTVTEIWTTARCERPETGILS
jgi:hypothetical protein